MSLRVGVCCSQVFAFLRRHWRFLLLSALMLIGAGVFFIVRSLAEPSYQTLAASEWLEKVRTNRFATIEVAKAFEKMGPDGAKYLGEQLERRPSRFYFWALAHHQSIPLSFRKLILKSEWHYRGDVIVSLLANMGTNAAPAMPAVITWLENQPPLPPPPPTTFVRNSTSSLVYVSQTIHTATGSYNTNILLYALRTNQPSLRKPNFGISPVVTNYFSQTQIVVSAPGLVTTNIVTTLSKGVRPLSWDAFNVLVNNGSDDPRIIPLLLNPLNDATFYRRVDRYSLNLKPAIKNSLPYIIQQIETTTNIDRKLAALAMIRLVIPESRIAHGYMVASLRSTDGRVFDFAIRSLQTTTNDLELIVPLAIDGLTRFRNRTTDLYEGWIPPVYPALKEFSRYNPQVVPQLQTAILQVDPYEQVGILQLLQQIGSREGVDLALIESFTTNRIGMVRSAAWSALGKLKGEPLAEALSQIAIQDNGPHIVPEEAYAKIAALKTEAAIAVPTLIYYLNSDHIGTLTRTIETLGSMGPAAREAVGPLRKLLGHPEEAVREKASASLRLIEGK